MVAAAGGTAFAAARFAVCCGFFLCETPEGDVAAVAGDLEFDRDWRGGGVGVV